MVTDWTSQHDKHEAMRIIGAAGIPAGAVLDTAELLARRRRSSARGIMQTIEHPTVRAYKMPAWPVRFAGAAAAGAAVAAAGAAHRGRAERTGWGWTRARCGDLRGSGVIG